MEPTILGLDVGTNSLGWALLGCDEDGNPNRIVDMGVRIFQEAVEKDAKGAGPPKNQARQAARSARRRNERRRRRRQNLLNALVRAEMLPETEEERNRLLQDQMHYNPYELRARGLDEQLTLFEFGRAIYHLNQRRGFKSNRLAEDTGDDGTVKQGISELRKKMDKKQSRTLGEFLSEQKKKRGRYTHRDMFEEEFESLWKTQSSFHPEILTDALNAELHNIMFWQRPLSNRPGRRSPKNPRKRAQNPIGRCPFEPNRRRANAAWPVFQKFRILQDLNNLKLIDPESTEERALTQDERRILFKELSAKRTMSWNQVREKLGLHSGEKFNLEEGGKKELKGNHTNWRMRKILNGAWDRLPQEKQEELITDLLTIQDMDPLLRRLQNHWGFSSDVAIKLAKAELENRYAHLSVKALRGILPYLEEGMLYDKACNAAGYDHRGTHYKSNRDFLPEPLHLRNPVVQKALFEVRKVVNALIKRYGKPTEIRVEMARELKQTRKKKQEIADRNRKNEARNKQIVKILQEEFPEFRHREPRPYDIVRYKLWEECNLTCPYTGQQISKQMLFSGEVDIEHIIPYSRSLDDSYMNKTLCLAKENRQVKRVASRSLVEIELHRSGC